MTTVDERVVVAAEKPRVVPGETANEPVSAPPPPRSRVPEYTWTAPELLSTIPMPEPPPTGPPTFGLPTTLVNTPGPPEPAAKVV